MREREKDTSQPRYTLSQVHSSWTVEGVNMARKRERERERFVYSQGVKGQMYKSGV